ncbi:hypothetical protein QFC20_005391 [Naganishia adeliensis]|uniref:Uncharacterized protein n=1 Tax=Naganishia adeliensis TaxID=92952 RepID=A0ACC2VNP4_9TREE|nr:hypothetical protein QFC20_005391 [Naganishia adeliensis]
MITFATVPVSIVQNRWWEGNGWDWESLLKSPPVLALAEKHGLTVQQVLFKFCQSIGITPLSGTTNEQHMEEDVAVESAPDFAEEDVKALETALRKAAVQMG